VNVHECADVQLVLFVNVIVSPCPDVESVQVHEYVAPQTFVDDALTPLVSPGATATTSPAFKGFPSRASATAGGADGLKTTLNASEAAGWPTTLTVHVKYEAQEPSSVRL
jgi:hypothetical protein